MNSISSLQIFNVFRFVTTLLTGILLTKSGLPTGELSIYELLLFLSNLVSFFWVMGGQNAFLQYFPRLHVTEEGAILQQEFPKKDNLSLLQQKGIFNAFLLFLFLSILAAGVLWGLRITFFDYFNNGQPVPYLDLICWYIIFNTPTYLIHIYYLVLERFKVLLAWGAFTFGMQLLAVVIPIFLGYSLEITFWALLILSLVRFGWMIQILWRHAIFQFDLSFYKKIRLVNSTVVITYVDW